jgi:hypothetical protein
MSNLRDALAIVTGASSGIGEATARALAARGQQSSPRCSGPIALGQTEAMMCRKD